MQSFLRALNIVLSPVLTLYFASKFASVIVAGRSAVTPSAALPRASSCWPWSSC